MGCDIHLHAEVKIKNAWHHYAHPSVPRSYPLFSIMAGVHESVMSGSKPSKRRTGTPRRPQGFESLN